MLKELFKGAYNVLILGMDVPGKSIESGERECVLYRMDRFSMYLV